MFGFPGMKAVAAWLLPAACVGCATPLHGGSWQRTEHTLALVEGTNVVWRIVADPAEGKPYFHPLATPEGIVLTDLRPEDHPWHRGLWWSWKLINGLNYWEEDRQTHRSEAATELVEHRFQPHDDGSADLGFSLTYHPWGAAAVLTEERTLHVSAPVAGQYEVDWHCEFTALTNVVLARTGLPGELQGAAFGGYAGLSLRLNPAMRQALFISSTGVSGAAAVHGQPAEWVKFSGGPGRVAVTIFDDAGNERHPTRWYANQAMPFVSPALLFNAPLTLDTGGKLRLRYRIVITDHDSPDTKTSPPK